MLIILLNEQIYGHSNGQLNSVKLSPKLDQFIELNCFKYNEHALKIRDQY